MGKSTTTKVIFAGGGTGGHIYPGLALAQYLEEKHLNQESLFIGSDYGLEKQILSTTKYSLKTTVVRPFNQGGFFLKIKSIFWYLPISIVQAITLLIKIKPKWVLSLGSYVAVPVGIAAFLLKIPLFVWEPNAKAGLANRLLSYFSCINFIIFKEVKTQLKGKCLESGLPLRKELIEKINKLSASTSLEKKIFSQGNPFKILIVGGSLGSDFLNTNFCDVWSSLYKYPVSVIHQTGSQYFQKTEKLYKIHDKKIEYKVVKYLPNIYNEYQWADLVISRAGIGTLFELAACGKASLLVPYSLSADNHQCKNAKNLEKNNQALMLEEQNFSILKVKKIIENFIQSPEELASLEKNITSFYTKNTESFIVETISKSIK